MWTLEEGLQVIRNIDPYVRDFGHCCALTGGVLFKGVSDKDLDIIITPFENDPKVIYNRNHQELMNCINRNLESIKYQKIKANYIKELMYRFEIAQGKIIEIFFPCLRFDHGDITASILKFNTNGY